MFSVARTFVALAIGYLALAIEAKAQEASSWKVDKSSGDVWVVTAGAQNVALTSETGLKDGDSVRTGKNGRVMLRRGQETILVAPNSVVGLPAETKPGSTTIIQQAGSILLEVNKRDARTFEVETPYLVAAVKGTQFRVTVGAKGAGVNVTHGSVEVADVKSGKFALVMPGQAANVSAIGIGGLTLQGNGTFNPIQNGAPRPSTIGRVPVPRGGLMAPVSIRASLHSVRSSGHGGGLRIAAPIGQVRLDVNTATRGLARDAGTSGSTRSAATIWNNGNDQSAAAASRNAAANAAAPSAAIGTSVAPALNNSRPDDGPAAGRGPGHGRGYAYGNGHRHGNPGNNGNGNGGGNGRGNNGNGNGGGHGNNGGGNGNSGNGGGNGNNGNGGGNGNNGNGGGNGHANGNGNGNGGRGS